MRSFRQRASEMGLVAIGLGATAVVAGFATTTGDFVLFGLAMLALAGQLVGLKRVQTLAEESRTKA